MTTILISIAIFAVLMAGMAVGVIFSNKELQGSCGGVGGKECTCTDPEKLAACKNREGGPGEKLVAVDALRKA